MNRSSAVHLHPVVTAQTQYSLAQSRCRTGNVVAALVRHTTSRPIDSHVDRGAVVFHGSWDPGEGRWKALENRDLLLALMFTENVYYHELSKALIRQGYQIQNRLRGDFELAGVSEELCRRFSKRDAQIDAALDALLKERPDLAHGNLKALREWTQTLEVRAVESSTNAQDPIVNAMPSL